MYGLQPISSSVPNPSASGLRTHDYAIRAGGPGGAAVQVAPGLLRARTPVMTTNHAIIGECGCFCFCIRVCATLSVALGVWSVVHPPLG